MDEDKLDGIVLWGPEGDEEAAGDSVSSEEEDGLAHLLSIYSLLFCFSSVFPMSF